MNYPLRDETASDRNLDETFRPIRNRVVIRVELQKQSATLWTPDEKLPIIGEVMAVGKGERSEETGHEWTNYVKIGDRIAVSPFMGVHVLWKGAPSLIVCEDEVLAILGMKRPGIARVSLFSADTRTRVARYLFQGPDEGLDEFTKKGIKDYHAADEFKILSDEEVAVEVPQGYWRISGKKRLVFDKDRGEIMSVSGDGGATQTLLVLHEH